MDLTQEIILQHGQHSPFKGKLKDATLSVKMENALCGDSIGIDLKIEKGKVLDAAFVGEGCLISQAAASLLVGQVKKVKGLNKIKKFDQKLILKLLGIPLTPSRVQCAMLSLQVLKKMVSG